jgi:hypothetical protein
VTEPEGPIAREVDASRLQRRRRTMHGLRPSLRFVTKGVVASISLLALLAAAPASASVLSQAGSDPDLSRSEARQYGRWWEEQVRGESLLFAGEPIDALGRAAERAWAAGVSRTQLQAALFSDAALDLFAANYAGGEGRPSPYLAYFTNNPVQLGSLGDVFTASGSYVYGPGGTQEQLFDRFTGLRESYLASLGLREVNGRIVDPRAPLLTPYFASILLGDPQPLRQPAVARNVPAS